MNVTLDEREERIFKQLTLLHDIIKTFGWEDVSDERTIKPNMRRTQLFIRKNTKKITTLFPTISSKITKQNVVDVINPLLIQMWHVQIVGSPSEAKLERLYRQ